MSGPAAFSDIMELQLGVSDGSEMNTISDFSDNSDDDNMNNTSEGLEEPEEMTEDDISPVQEDENNAIVYES